MLRPYPVHCTQPGCPRLAAYKIAARWSDGVTHELKTYALSCAECLRDAYALARRKQAACRLTRGETLEAPGIYRIARGERDRELQRCPELERELQETLES